MDVVPAGLRHLMPRWGVFNWHIAILHHQRRPRFHANTATSAMTENSLAEPVETDHTLMSSLPNHLHLKDGWHICDAAELNIGGDVISTATSLSKHWLPTSIPSTVLAALVRNKVHVDPFLGTNLRDISTAQFEKPWWYRTEFDVSEDGTSKDALLEFDGVKIAVTHYPLYAQALARTGDYQAVFSGHTHQLHEERFGACLWVNPGEVLGWQGNPTCAIYDTATNSAEIISLKEGE